MARNFKKKQDIFRKVGKSSRFDFEFQKLSRRASQVKTFCAFRSDISEMCPGATVGPLCEWIRYKVRTLSELWQIMISFDMADKFRFEFGGPFRLAELLIWWRLGSTNGRNLAKTDRKTLIMVPYWVNKDGEKWSGDLWRCEDVTEKVFQNGWRRGNVKDYSLELLGDVWRLEEIFGDVTKKGWMSVVVQKRSQKSLRCQK